MNDENFKIIHGDIITQYADAIVIPVNTEPDIIGDGVDGLVYKYAGPELQVEREKIGKIAPGWAEVTDAYNLQGFTKIIHTAGTSWFKGICNEEEILRCCYINSLRQLTNKTLKIHSVSIPLLGAGANNYPPDLAITVAVDEITKFLEHNPAKTVYLVIKDELLHKQANTFRDQVGDYYSGGCKKSYDASYNKYPENRSEREGIQYKRYKKAWDKIKTGQSLNVEDMMIRNANSLNFSSTLQLLISDKKNITPGKIQKEVVNVISHTTFYEIFKGNRKVDNKRIVFAIGIALQADLDEMNLLLKSAGFSFSNDPIDTVVETFVSNKDYSFARINEAIDKIDKNLPTFDS